MNVLQIDVFPFFLFLLAIELSVFLHERFTLEGLEWNIENGQFLIFALYIYIITMFMHIMGVKAILHFIKCFASRYVTLFPNSHIVKGKAFLVDIATQR